jgi:hypothetical protein
MPQMLLVMPKLLYFGIAGHLCALVQLRKPSTGKGLANEKIGRLLVLSNLMKLCCGECKIQS